MIVSPLKFGRNLRLLITFGTSDIPIMEQNTMNWNFFIDREIIVEDLKSANSRKSINWAIQWPVISIKQSGTITCLYCISSWVRDCKLVGTTFTSLEYLRLFYF